MTQAITITTVLKSSDKNEQAHGNFYLQAELSDSNEVIYSKCENKPARVYITIKASGKIRWWEEGKYCPEQYSHLSEQINKQFSI
jgi:hypothetical protein